MEILRPLAVVTGASSGIGFELARQAASRGYDLIIAANESLEFVSGQLEKQGAEVIPVEVNLATRNGVQELYRHTLGRRVEVLVANASAGLGQNFLDQSFELIQSVINTNVTGTLELIRCVGRDMRDNGYGRILITDSKLATMPGGHHAVYHGSKAFLASFCLALRNELDETGITVTCLMPDDEPDPVHMARSGFDAMEAGAAGIAMRMPN